ncbi:MAG: 4-diphosphocytidyl-2-C-methyl-D-erythritol kinase [Gemmatimonadota bacterium]|nr:MAG: 4-diphosphocytidyl-2-C-methyl-D-erythritol kinase [Gemmatimonadota bacterium]
MAATAVAKERLVLESPAKINLNLEVLGPRADGFHAIRTVLTHVSLHDTVTLTPGGRKFVFHGGQGTPKDEGNLAYQAVKSITRKTGVRHGLDLRVVKRIPIAAGLGGGSSNAATVLRGLNELWGLGLSQSDLETMGLELGSDVPFFLRGGTCIATGRGEALEPIQHSVPFELVLVTPALKVTSEWAYGHLPAELTRSGTSTNMVKVALASGRVELLAAHLGNDLEQAVLPKHAVVREAKRKLKSAGAVGVLMSGSGPTVFGLASNAEHADQMAEKMSRSNKWKVVRANTLV